MLFYYQRHEMLAQSAKIKYLRFMYKSWKGPRCFEWPDKIKVQQHIGFKLPCLWRFVLPMFVGSNMVQIYSC